MPNSHRSMIAGYVRANGEGDFQPGRKINLGPMFTDPGRIMADRSLLDPDAALSPLGHFYYYVGGLELRIN